MGSRLRDPMAALALANLCFLPVWFELLFRPSSGDYYRQRALDSVDYAAALLGVGVLTLLFWGAAQFVRRFRSGVLLPLGSALVPILLLLPLNTVRVNVRLPFGVGRIWHWAQSHDLSALLLFLLAISLPLAWRPLRFVYRAPTALFLFTVPFAALTLGHCALLMVGPHPSLPPAPRPGAPVPPPRGGAPAQRVLWVVFDELDWSMIGPQRPHGLALASLDRLLRESLVAERAESPAHSTMTSLPALLIGKPVTAAKTLGSSDLVLAFSGESPSHRWSEQTTVFSRARELGLKSSLVGWYHPYCRILGAQLDDCFFEPVFLTTLGRAAPTRLVPSVADQILSLSPLNNRRLGVASYKRLLARTLAAVSDPEAGFVFVHMSVPHAPVIFDRQAMDFAQTKLSNVSGYVDNLQLVDRTIGDVRETLEASGMWEASTVLVSSDHPWREASAYDDRSSQYVPFILKLAHSSAARTYPRAFDTSCSAAILLESVRSAMKDPAEAAASLDRLCHDPNPSPPGSSPYS